MATVSTAQRSIEVTLLRPDAGPQIFTLAEGATLGDLLREAGAAIRSPNLLIDGRPMEEVLILQSGMTITIVPEPPQTPRKRTWRDTVGMFADDPTFEEAIAEGRAIREADRRAAREEADRENTCSS
jgi:hypothetical protein